MANTLARNGPYDTIALILYGTHLVEVVQGFVEVGEHARMELSLEYYMDPI